MAANPKEGDSQKKKGDKKNRYLKPLLIAHGSILLAATKAWGAKP